MNSKHIVIKYVWKRIVTNIKINRVLVVVATGSSSEVQSKSFPRESDRDELQTKWSEYLKKKKKKRGLRISMVSFEPIVSQWRILINNIKNKYWFQMKL